MTNTGLIVKNPCAKTRLNAATDQNMTITIARPTTVSTTLPTEMHCTIVSKFQLVPGIFIPAQVLKIFDSITTLLVKENLAI